MLTLQYRLGHSVCSQTNYATPVQWSEFILGDMIVDVDYDGAVFPSSPQAGVLADNSASRPGSQSLKSKIGSVNHHPTMNGTFGHSVTHLSPEMLDQRRSLCLQCLKRWWTVAFTNDSGSQDFCGLEVCWEKRSSNSQATKRIDLVCLWEI